MKPQIALQLWSIQEACKEDLAQTLRQVKEFGYDGVEFAGYHGKSAIEIKELLTELDLAVAGSHVPFDLLKNQLEETLDFEAAIGNRRVVVPYVSFSNLSDWQRFMQELDDIAKATSARGMQLYYHNHAHEFSEVPGIDLLDKMSQKVPELLLEVDLYWLAFAGKDVASWVRAHRESIGLFHMKDQQEQPKESTELGTGILPLHEYAQLAKELQLPWLIVEQEAFQQFPPLTAAQKNVEKLNEIVEEVYDDTSNNLE